MSLIAMTDEQYKRAIDYELFERKLRGITAEEQAQLLREYHS